MCCLNGTLCPRLTSSRACLLRKVGGESFRKVAQGILNIFDGFDKEIPAILTVCTAALGFLGQTLQLLSLACVDWPPAF